MEREIKFRVWNKDSKKWIKNLTYCIDDFSTTNKEWHLVSQYTGLKDKNGKDIYEGDIVNSGLGEIFYNTKKAKFQVKWHDEVFKRVRGNNQNYNDGEDLFMNCEIAWEVIGNIYENTELL